MLSLQQMMNPQQPGNNPPPSGGGSGTGGGSNSSGGPGGGTGGEDGTSNNPSDNTTYPLDIDEATDSIEMVLRGTYKHKVGKFYYQIIEDINDPTGENMSHFFRPPINFKLVDGKFVSQGHTARVNILKPMKFKSSTETSQVQEFYSTKEMILRAGGKTCKLDVDKYSMIELNKSRIKMCFDNTDS
jgi:hypothetical protein